VRFFCFALAKDIQSMSKLIITRKCLKLTFVNSYVGVHSIVSNQLNTWVCHTFPTRKLFTSSVSFFVNKRTMSSIIIKTQILTSNCVTSHYNVMCLLLQITQIGYQSICIYNVQGSLKHIFFNTDFKCDRIVFHREL
jgi:hypothetical protein